MKIIEVCDNQHASRILAFSHLLASGWEFDVGIQHEGEFGIGIFPISQYFDLRLHRRPEVDTRYWESLEKRFCAFFVDPCRSDFCPLDSEEFFTSLLIGDSDADLAEALWATLPIAGAYAYVDDGSVPLPESPIEKEFLNAYRMSPRPGCPALACQFPVGGYRLDFAVPELKVCIELDGHDFHKTKEQRTRDASRERWLQLNGWRVIRFTGSEIHKDAKACAQQAASFILQIKGE